MGDFMTLEFFYGLYVGAICGVTLGVTFAVIIRFLQEREANADNLKDETFYWWWGYGTDPEMFYGTYKTRDQAFAAAEDDAEPDETFTIIEANKQPTSDECFCFDGNDVWESFCERNDECWGEDGPPEAPDTPLLLELESKLTSTFGRWRRRHGLGKGFRFDETRNTEEHIWDDELEKRVMV